MLKFKKPLVLFLAIALVITSFAGCANKASTEDTSAPATASKAETPASDSKDTGIPKEFVTLKVLYPGDMSNRMKEFLGNEFKQKMKDELNIGLEVTYSPWDQYWNKKDMMLAAGETIEWYWDGISNLSKEYAKKHIVAIDDLLAASAPDIKKIIPEANLKAAMVDGKTYGIPSAYSPSAAPFQMACIRQDVMDAVGISDIKSSADLEQLAAKSKEKFPSMNVASMSLLPALAREFGDQVYTFPTDGYILAVGQNDNKVYSFYETEAFKKLAKFNRSLYLKKYIPDEVTVKYNEKDARMDSGNYVWGEGSIAKAMERTPSLLKNAPDAKLKSYLLAPDKPKYIEAPGNECIFISSTGKYHDRAMMFLNWIYKSKDNYLFTVYGVKDKDYKIENNRINKLNNDDLFYEWMFRNVNYMEFPGYVDDAYITQYKEWDKDAKYANTFGFTFDSTPVKNEEGKLIQELGTMFRPMSTGFLDYDQNYEKALKRFKDAGIDKYMAEFQKQLDAYLASKK